jgi:hypothetical protein
MTEAEGPMAIRVLATIPELAAELPLPADAPLPAAAAEADAPPPRPTPRPAARADWRVRPRTSFPGVSIAALALVAAAIWSLVAIRELKQSATDAERPRLAAESADAGASETTLR